MLHYALQIRRDMAKPGFVASEDEVIECVRERLRNFECVAKEVENIRKAIMMFILKRHKSFKHKF